METGMEAAHCTDTEHRVDILKRADTRTHACLITSQSWDQIHRKILSGLLEQGSARHAMEGTATGPAWDA